MGESKAIYPWGRLATFGLGVAALLAGQLVALAALTWWYGSNITRLPDFTGDGSAVTLIIFASNPVQFVLLAVWAWVRGASAIDYLGFIWPRRSDVILGIIAVIVLIAVGDAVSWLIGRDVVTSFQDNIYRTASADRTLPLLWLAVVLATPIGEEALFRGFLFRGWLRKPGDAWPAIVLTALLWALIHVQYDWFIVCEIFVSGLLLGWLRWASGSTILTIFLHALINFEGMSETFLAFHGSAQVR
jgi:membrane protease YdiL (CAAX protease family)